MKRQPHTQPPCHSPISSNSTAHRGFTAKQYLLAAAVVSVVTLGGAGGYMYYRSNSPQALDYRAQIALSQHDTAKAIGFIQKALDKNPTGPIAITLRDHMARALIDADRESDARVHLQDALALKPDDAETLDLLAESHVHVGLQKLAHAPKPLTETSINIVLTACAAEIDALEKMPQTPRNQVALARLHHLVYMILEDQTKQATARFAAAKLSGDTLSADKAAAQIAAMPKSSIPREKSLELLNAALKQDPKHAKAGQFLVQYLYEDRRFAEALARYQQLKSEKVINSDMVINAANIMIVDSARQPVLKTRFGDAQKELEAYLADNPQDPAAARVMVAIGNTLLQQDKVVEATQMATRASALSPYDLDAQILLINAKLRDKKTADALALVTPLSNSNGGVPQVWYLLGQANADAGDLRAAEDAYKKALSLDPMFILARRALLINDIRSQNSDAAVLHAGQELKEDPFFIPAWEVTAQDFQRRGLVDRAQNFLASLAANPDLPDENRADVVQLLLKYDLPADAEKILAKMPADDEATLRLRSLAATAAGHLSEARTLLARDVAANPDNTDLRLRYAELLLRSNMAPDARAQLDQIVQAAAKAPLSAPDWLRVARDYIYLRLPDRSLVAARQALALQPRNLDALSLQRQAEAMLSGAPATQDLAPAINSDQATVADNVRLASAALAKKDFESALTLARTGLAKDAGNVALHQLAARALAGMDKYDQAVDEIVASAQSHKESPSSFIAFVELFPSKEAALKGIGFGNQLQAINPALGDWAMGRLAEISGDNNAALSYYKAGLANANPAKTLDPAAAKDLLYRALLSYHASQKDIAGLKSDADTFSKEPNFTVGIRILAADHLRLLGDPAGVVEQIDKLAAVLGATPTPTVLLTMAQRYLAVNQHDRALALMEKYAPVLKNDPQFLDAYASTLEQRDPAKALPIREQLVKLDPSNPQLKIALAQVHAALGDEADAFRLIDDARNQGETGRELAANARLRLLISMGLLHEAADEMAAGKSNGGGAPGGSAGASGDFASMLAIGQSWAQLSRPDDARKTLAAIPPYAAEYAAAQSTLAALDSAAGNDDAAIKTASRPGLEPELFETYLRAHKPADALDLAKKQIALHPVNTIPWRTWTIYAATAARDNHAYGDAVGFLSALDPVAKKASAIDIAMLDLLDNKPNDAMQAAQDLADDPPTWNRSTILLLANAPSTTSPPAALFDSAPASTLYAWLAPARAHDKPVPELAKNSRVIPGDIQNLLAELSTVPDKAAAQLRQLALAQRLIEMGWTSTALAVLDNADKSGPPTTLALLQRHRAMTELHRAPEAAAIADKFAAQAKDNKPLPPSVRILLAAVAEQKEDYAGAIAALEPLVPLNRPDILTTLATFHEKAGQLDQAIALHRQIRKLDPNFIAAANNLAYTLAAAHPADKAALAEARTAIQSAIDKAPNIAVFQDTLAWIEILSNDPAAGAKRLAKNLPALRLNPAIHYHLGIAYAKLGQTDLARLHLQNVQYLAQSKTPIPEIPLAAEALKTLASSQK